MQREVTRSRKNRDGDILALCKPGATWSPRAKADAISDIDNNRHEYTAVGPRGQRARIRVVNGSSGKYLRTDWDDTQRNNLEDLPDC